MEAARAACSRCVSHVHDLHACSHDGRLLAISNTHGSAHPPTLRLPSKQTAVSAQAQNLLLQNPLRDQTSRMSDHAHAAADTLLGPHGTAAAAVACKGKALQSGEGQWRAGVPTPSSTASNVVAAGQRGAAHASASAGGITFKYPNKQAQGRSGYQQPRTLARQLSQAVEHSIGPLAYLTTSPGTLTGSGVEGPAAGVGGDVGAGTSSGSGPWGDVTLARQILPDQDGSTGALVPCACMP